MQVALIPPTNYLTYTTNRPLQMILPARLKSMHYRHRYNPEWRLSDEFVILDNGMFEDDTMSNENLIELADKWQVDELVMPDVRGDMRATIDASTKFLNMFEQIKFDKEPSLMIVVQVSHRAEVDEFIGRALNMFYIEHGLSNNLTFGIPRRLAETLNPEIRIEIMTEIRACVENVPVHLLGYARNASHARIFNEVALLADHVRSIDTDAPFVWAYNESRIELDPTPFERPLGYDRMIDIDDVYIRANIKTLDGWANGRS
jgi:hypothetical protein